MESNWDKIGFLSRRMMALSPAFLFPLCLIEGVAILFLANVTIPAPKIAPIVLMRADGTVSGQVCGGPSEAAYLLAVRAVAKDFVVTYFAWEEGKTGEAGNKVAAFVRFLESPENEILGKIRQLGTEAVEASKASGAQFVFDGEPRTRWDKEARVYPVIVSGTQIILKNSIKISRHIDVSLEMALLPNARREGDEAAVVGIRRILEIKKSTEGGL